MRPTEPHTGHHVVPLRTYLAGAEPPDNDGERRVIEALVRGLPDSFTLFPGVQVIHRGRTDDIDILLLAPWYVAVIEVKDLAGDVVIADGECYVDSSPRPQPYNLTNAKARRIKSRLQPAFPAVASCWVQSRC